MTIIIACCNYSQYTEDTYLLYQRKEVLEFATDAKKSSLSLSLDMQLVESSPKISNWVSVED